MNHGENARHKKERRERGEKQAADDGAAERSVLLAAFAEAEGHGHHADDHGESGHDDRTDANEAGFESGVAAFLPSAICSRAKETIKMLLAVATPMHMIAPVSEGTFKRGVGDQAASSRCRQARRAAP